MEWKGILKLVLTNGNCSHLRRNEIHTIGLFFQTNSAKVHNCKDIRGTAQWFYVLFLVFWFLFHIIIILL